MKFIVDESTGRTVVEYLRTNGHDVISVAESMPQAKDQSILECATEQQHILITNDKDFGELVFRSGKAHGGVVERRQNVLPPLTPPYKGGECTAAVKLYLRPPIRACHGLWTVV